MGARFKAENEQLTSFGVCVLDAEERSVCYYFLYIYTPKPFLYNVCAWALAR